METNENLFNAGRIAALEQTVKNILAPLPGATDLIAQLKELTADQGNVVDMHSVPQLYKDGIDFTIKVLEDAVLKVTAQRQSK